MTYSLFELSQNQEVQDKARDNIKKVLEKHGGSFTYDAVMDMAYIENCILGNIISLWWCRFRIACIKQNHWENTHLLLTSRDHA